MKSDAQVDAAAAPPYVSTGHLPPPERVRALVAAAYERFKSNEDGKNADVYPALAADARGSVRRVRCWHQRRYLRHRRLGLRISRS